jgi:hypothetical protein
MAALDMVMAGQPNCLVAFFLWEKCSGARRKDNSGLRHYFPSLVAFSRENALCVSVVR